MIKYFKFQTVFPLIIITFFVTRLANIGILPIFTDEAIYTYWAKVALNDPAHRYISLEDGKQPLFIWIAAIIQEFIADPLVAARLVSFFSGLASVIGIYLLSKELFRRLPYNNSEKIALLSALLYVIIPFTLLYDRLALYDSLLTMLGLYAVFLSVKMVRKARLDIAMLNGFAIGLALITKSSGNFFLYFIPFSLIIFNFKSNKTVKKLVLWSTLSLVTLVITQIMYNSLRLSPLFYLIERKNLEFIRSIAEVKQDPLIFAISNFKAITTWLAIYTSYPLFLIFLLGLIIGYLKRDSRVVYLSALILIPFSVEVVFNKVLYPRFMLFYFPYILIIISYSLVIILEKFKKYSAWLTVATIILLLLPSYTSYKLLTNPAYANIPENDSNQLFNDWPAGYGVSEIVELIRKESENEPVYIGTQGTFGLFPHSLSVYLWGNENVRIFSYWPVDPQNLPSEFLKYSESFKTYFIFNENQKDINNSRLKLISKYRKGTGNSFMRLYEVTPR